MKQTGKHNSILRALSAGTCALAVAAAFGCESSAESGQPAGENASDDEAVTPRSIDTSADAFDPDEASGTHEDVADLYVEVTTHPDVQLSGEAEDEANRLRLRVDAHARCRRSHHAG